MNDIEVYAPPDQAADFTIRNLGDGEVVINDGAMGTPIQIGEAKRRLFLMIKALDKQAKEWGVANNLDRKGKKKKLEQKRIMI